MAPAEQDVVQTAVRLVDTVLGVQLGVVVIRVSLEGVGVNDLVGELATNDESVTDNVPLTVGTEKAEELAEIVNQTSDLHPLGLAVSSNGLSGLKKMLDLAHRGVRVGLVDKVVKKLHGFPDRHASTDGVSELLSDLDIILVGLLQVLLLNILLGTDCDKWQQMTYRIEALDSVTSILVLPESGLVFLLVKLAREVVFDLCLSLLDSILLLELQDVDLVDLVRHFIELGGLVLDVVVDLGSVHFGCESVVVVGNEMVNQTQVNLGVCPFPWEGGLYTADIWLVGPADREEF